MPGYAMEVDGNASRQAGESGRRLFQIFDSGTGSLSGGGGRAGRRFLLAATTLAMILSSLVAPLIGQPRSAAAHQELVPLYTWYSSSRGDYFSTTNPTWSGGPGDVRSPDYQFMRIEGQVFHKDGRQMDGTVPLYHWYNPERGDNFTTTDTTWASDEIGEVRDGYYFVSMEGYIHDSPRSGTLPLRSWWSAFQQDNYATTAPQWSGEIGYTLDDYGMYRIDGYLIPPDEAQPPMLPEAFGYDSMVTYGGGTADGQRPLLVVLVEYSDAPLMHAPSELEELVFGPSYPNAVDYFRNNSYGHFNWTENLAGVVGPFTYRDMGGSSVDESTIRCTLNVKDASDAQLCPGTLSNLGIFRQRVMAWAGSPSGGNVDFSTFDADGNGSVTNSELGVVMIGAGLPESEGLGPWDGGEMRFLCPADSAGFGVPVLGGVRFCGGVTDMAENMSFTTLVHEMSHLLGTTDLYGSSCLSWETTLMSCTMYNAPEFRRTYALDPWHKMKLGWLKPRIYSTQDPGASANLFAAQMWEESLAQPVLLYDPQRGTDEFFLLEYRSRTDGGYDSDLADSAGGVAIWHVQLGAGGMPKVISPGLAGGDSQDSAVWTVGAPDSTIGGTGLWRSEHGEIALTWADGTPVDVHISVGTPSGYPERVAVSWRHTGIAATSRVDEVRFAASPAGTPIALHGSFPVGVEDRRVRMYGGPVMNLEILGSSATTLTVQVPSEAPPGTYRVIVYDEYLSGYTVSNEIEFTVVS